MSLPHTRCHRTASNMSCVRRALSLSHACAQTRNLLWLLVCNRVCDRVWCYLSPTSCVCWCAIGSLLTVAQYIYTPLSPPPPLPLSLFPSPAHPSTPLSDVHSPNHPLICRCLCGHSLQYNVHLFNIMCMLVCDKCVYVPILGTLCVCA